jgi:hypothetical protein
MMMRLIHLIVVAALVAAAGDVYKIKFESTLQAERVAKLGAEIKRERDAIAGLRAEWALLDNPARIQALAQRHLTLKLIDPAQIEHLDRLPERPLPPVAPTPSDAIARIIESIESDLSTGGIAAPATAPPRVTR